eukprot:Skav228770  [mRNA]  locus=scaffold589:500023:501552:- [translate_table: standard]
MNEGWEVLSQLYMTPDLTDYVIIERIYPSMADWVTEEDEGYCILTKAQPKTKEEIASLLATRNARVLSLQWLQVLC